jgi:uncharacterized protein (DUF58 family)
MSESLLEPGMVAQLERLELVVRRLFSGRLRGEKRSRRRGQGSEFADYRDYSQGDDLRHIDWNIYGRLDRLFLKLFHEEEDLHLSIWIDASTSMTYGEPAKLLYAKKAAAALAYIALCNQDRVTIEAASAERFEATRPLRGKPQLFRLLEFLDSIRGEGETDLERGLKAFALRNPSPGMKIAISDFLDKAGFAAPLRWLLRGRSQPVAVHVLSPQEVEPDLVGDLTLEDSEDGGVKDVSISAPLLRSYRRSVEALCGNLKEFSRSRGISYFFTQTSVPLEEVILKALRAGGVVRS